MTNTVDMAARVAELEARVAFQDDTLDTLNDVLVALRQQLDELARDHDRLREQVLANHGSPGEAPVDDGPPPHY